MPSLLNIVHQATKEILTGTRRSHPITFTPSLQSMAPPVSTLEHKTCLLKDTLKAVSITHIPPVLSTGDVSDGANMQLQTRSCVGICFSVWSCLIHVVGLSAHALSLWMRMCVFIAAPDYNNKCILPNAGASYLKIGGIAGAPSGYSGGGEWPSTRKPLDCLSGDKGGPEFVAFNAGIQLGNNTLYVPGGNATISCGKASVHISEFQTKGMTLHLLQKEHTNGRNRRCCSCCIQASTGLPLCSKCATLAFS